MLTEDRRRCHAGGWRTMALLLARDSKLVRSRPPMHAR
jgi:hypothetical protein